MKTKYLVKEIEEHWTKLLMYPLGPDVIAYSAAVKIALAQAPPIPSRDDRTQGRMVVA